jgi:hypothetical protein
LSPTTKSEFPKSKQFLDAPMPRAYTEYLAD